jgi:hypothetical protein
MASTTTMLDGNIDLVFSPPTYSNEPQLLYGGMATSASVSTTLLGPTP